MRRTLVLLRHGQTAWNREDRAQGHADVPLDDTGRDQASRAAAVLADAGATALWSSDLARARESAEIIGAACDLVPVLDKRLREFDIGVRSGLTWTEFGERHPREYTAWLAGESIPVPGEESEDEVEHRMGEVLRECLTSLADGDTAIVVSHGASIKSGIGALLDWPVGSSRGRLVGMENCSWARLIEHDGRLRLASYNVGIAPDFATAPPGR